MISSRCPDRPDIPPEELAGYLAQIRAILSTVGKRVPKKRYAPPDAALTEKYLAACAAKSAPPREPGDDASLPAWVTHA